MENQLNNFMIEIEQEEDNRWIAEIPDLAGVLVYENTKQEAIIKVKTLALRVIADNIENSNAKFNGHFLSNLSYQLLLLFHSLEVNRMPYQALVVLDR